jgi:hypothetical protein
MTDQNNLKCFLLNNISKLKVSEKKRKKKDVLNVFSFFALTRWDSGGYFSQSTTQPLLP